MTTSSGLPQVALTSALALGAKVFMVAISYATQLILARFYGAELMGTFFIATNLIMLLGTICSLGLDTGLLRYAALLKEKGQSYLIPSLLWKSVGIVIGFSMAGAAGIYLGRSWIADYFHAPTLNAMIVYFALALPLYGTTFLLRETLRGLGAVLWATFTQYVFQSGGLLLLIILCYFFLAPWGVEQSRMLALSFLGSVLLTLTILVICTRIKFKGGYKKDVGGIGWTDLWHYSRTVFLNTSIQIAIMTADSLILALFQPPAEVAYYGVALKTASFIGLPLIAVNAVVPVWFVRHYQRQELAEMEHLAGTTSRWMYYLALPVSLIFILLSSELLSFFGPQFSTARYALSILAVGQLINVSVGSTFYLLMMTGHQRSALKIQGLGFICCLPLMYLLAAQYGLTGLAVAVALQVSMINILAAWLVWKKLHIKCFVNRHTYLTLATLAVFLFAIFIRVNWGPLYALVYFLLLYSVILLTVIWVQREWELVRTMASK